MNTKKSTQKEIKDKDISKICQKRVWYDSYIAYLRNNYKDLLSKLYETKCLFPIDIQHLRVFQRLITITLVVAIPLLITSCWTRSIVATCPGEAMVSGDTHALNAYLDEDPQHGSIQYSSNNTTIATVNSTGTITARRPGSATIRMYDAGNNDYDPSSNTCEVEVICRESSRGLHFSEANSTIQVGEEINIADLLLNTTGQTTINWSSNNPCATVLNGVVHGVSGGSAIITAAINDWEAGDTTFCGKYATFEITVNCGVFSIYPSVGACETIDPSNPLIDDGICYVTQCAGPTSSVTLQSDVSNLSGPVSYHWEWNAHDGNGITSGTNASITIPTPSQQGIDVKLTVTDATNCVSTKKARIRVAGGITVEAGDLPNKDMGNICVGEKSYILIGSNSEPGENSIHIDQPPVEINATLSAGAETFIPDGSTCANAVGGCYTSEVTFTEFNVGEKVDLASDIDHVLINMEHTSIGDLRITLQCPRDENNVTRSVTILNPTTNMPYHTAECMAKFKVYNKSGGDCGVCGKGSYIEDRWKRVYVIKNGNTYSSTGIRQEATSFAEDPTTQAGRNVLGGYLLNMIQANATPPDFCEGDYYYEFIGWYSQNTNDYTYTASAGTMEGDQQYNRWSSEVASLGFGIPNVHDARSDVNKCNSECNSAGTGWDYIWSENVSAYTIAAGTMYSTANHQQGITSGMVVNPSYIYDPEESFSRLVGCPLNGTWKIEVCDTWGLDNGYIFSWELGLSDAKMPNTWGFVDTIVSRALSCDGVTTSSNRDTLWIIPDYGQSSGECNLVLTDNWGCQITLDNRIKFHFDSAWVHKTSGILKQTICYGENVNNITYEYGGKANSATVAWRRNGAIINPANYSTYGITTTMVSPTESEPGMWSGGSVTVGITPTQPGLYSYTIMANKCPSCTLCESKVIYDTITVYETPIVNAGTDIVNCTAGQSTTLTATATYTYGDVDIESWSWTPSTDLAAPTNASTVEAAPTTTRTYTVTATDEHGCSNSDQVQVTVNQLNATIEFGD